MNISRAEKKAEAISRMKMLGYYGPAKEKFRRSNKVLVNEPPFGGVYDPEDSVQAAIEEFENKTNGLVYLVCRVAMEFGIFDSFLYVSDNAEEWEDDRLDLRHGEAFTYTVNKDDTQDGEFGYIGIKRGLGAGIVRVA